MCGIAAILGYKEPDISEKVECMIRSMRHRGPDEQGVHKVSGGALGHCRLSVIDLVEGRQPMASWDKRYWVIYNGEIYNYRELRKELEQHGHMFQTHSDTEVVIEVYRKHGPAGLSLLNGMYAFALWDEQERTLFAARDRMGKKPLYYHVANGKLVLASELKGLLAAGLFNSTINNDAVDAYLKYGYVPPGMCIYREVESLPAGHWMQWSDGEIKTRRYWEIRFREEPYMPRAAAEEFLALLNDAVRIRLLASDVPVGIFLSGGLDSGAITLLGQGNQTRPLHTFGVHIEGHYDETPYAKEIAAKAGCEHHHVNLRINPIDLFEKQAEIYDEPLADPACIPTYMLAEYTRNHCKVVLTGDGGDELLGGYDAQYLSLMRSENVPNRGWRYHSLQIAHQVMNRYMNKLCFSSPLKEVMLAADCARRFPDPLERYTSHGRLNNAARKDLLVASINQYPSIEDRCPPDIRGMNRVLWYDIESLLNGNMLVKVDRATMAVGLEARCPLLDYRLVEFANCLPIQAKISGMTCKKILRDAVGDLLPESIKTRKKSGFGTPLELWIRNDQVRSALLDWTCTPNASAWEILDRSMMTRILDDYYCRSVGYPDAVYTLVSLLFWFDRHRMGDCSS